MLIVAALLDRVATGHGRDKTTPRQFAEADLGAVRSLPLQHRLCVALRFVVGLTAAETADTMGTSEAAVKAMEYRAALRLRDASAETAAA